MQNRSERSANSRNMRNVVPACIEGDASAWRDRLSKVFVELDFVQASPKEQLSALVYEHAFGDLTFIRTVVKGGKHRVRRSQALIRKSPHNVFFIACLLRGEATITQNDRTAVLKNGDIAILDSTQEYVTDVEQGFDALWVRVPRHRIEGRLAHHSRLMAERINGSKGIGRLASVMLRTSFREAPRVVATDANRATNAILDLIGMSLSSRIAYLPNSSRSCQSTLRRIQRYIEDHLDDQDLTLSSVAMR